MDSGPSSPPLAPATALVPAAASPGAPARAGRTALPAWLPFLLVACVWGVVATWNIGLPGVYMDEVNPDYLAVKLLNPAHQPIIAWVLQGNYLLGDRVPWMVSLYHGSQTFWLGLPFFWLLGTTVEGLRVAHAALGLGVLASLFWLLRRAHLGSIPAALCCALLAADPSFSYAFRTQSYITLSASAWLLLAAGLVASPDVRERRRFGLAGVLAGFAATGYFIQGFYFVALVPAAWLLARGAAGGTSHARRRLAVGLALGLAPIALGYLLLMRHVGGPAALLDFYAQQQSALGAFSSTLAPVGRVAYAWRMVEGVVGNAWHHAMMFGVWQPIPGSTAKLAALIVLPVLLCAWAEWQGRASAALRLCLAMPPAFVAVALVFGNRLGGHHYVTILPWAYAALALGLRDALALTAGNALMGTSRPAQSRRRLVAATVAITLGAINVTGQRVEARTLQATGGVGLMSDAINRYAADLRAGARKPFVFFPDWGLSLPVAFLTRGEVGMSPRADVARARRLLCRGHDVEIALVHDRDTRAAAWTRSLALGQPTLRHYRQRDGTTVFDVLRFDAARAPAAACRPG